MHILVLDTIHGGKEIAAAYMAAGHSADAVDVYTGTTPVLLNAAQARHYDLVAAPVHLDPGHPLLAGRAEPVITHHEAVLRLLGDALPHPFVEITGARGKTTTAHALASVLPGTGLLHTSTGTYAFPEKTVLWKRSITPASLLPAAAEARRRQGWLIAEVSLGVSGAGDIAIITSPEDYPFAAGRKTALAAKIASAARARQVLVADGIPADGRRVLRAGDLVSCTGDTCTAGTGGREWRISNPLFRQPAYREPLMLAAAAAVLLGYDPSPLASFTALPGRMAVSREQGVVIVDNANSGVNEETTLAAARYARELAGISDLTLVIGQPEGDGAVCENFSQDQIARAIAAVNPARVIRVGRPPADPAAPARNAPCCATLEEGRRIALEQTPTGSIVVSVKTWR